MTWERINAGLYKLYGYPVEVEIIERDRAWYVWIDGAPVPGNFTTLGKAKNFVYAVIEVCQSLKNTKIFKNY